MHGVSGINMEHAEDLEIIKYRPGGIHELHVDQFNEESVIIFFRDPYLSYCVNLLQEYSAYGNRIAQGILFLTNTKLGGNFAMPMLGVVFVPTPGSLVVWHNTDRRGNMDRRSLHGGCRLFKGQKIAGQTCAVWLDQDKLQCPAEPGIKQLA